MIEAGTLIVKILEKQNVERVFCVPGESYLSVMNGLQDTSIEQFYVNMRVALLSWQKQMASLQDVLELLL